jgi:hypothetical protein
MKKPVTILLFILLYTLGKSCSLKGYKYCEIAIGKKSLLIEAKSVSPVDQSEIPKFKKKYKRKALQVIVPLIPNLIFTEYCYYSVFSPKVTKKTNSFFLYCAQGKRGPPAIQV